MKYSLACLVLLVTSGCYRGYKTAEELEGDDRGPTACASSCRELGMEMTAFVLVENSTSGCVCSPKGSAGTVGATAAAAASHVLAEQERAAQQAQYSQANK